MKRIIKWLEETQNHLQDDYDSVTLVIGDEGKGKSTLILEMGWLWLDIVDDREQTVDDAMDQIAWDLGQFKEHMASKPRYSCIQVHDAARVLSRKKAMHGDQIDVEEDLLDMRFGRFLMFLGYQEFDLVPTMLATRRAKSALYIPERGIVHGYGESGIRERYEEGEWPDPAMKDTYPSLEGKDLWSRFKAEDARRKQQRIAPDEDEEEEEMTIEELADRIIDDGLEDIISIHGGHHRPYIDRDLIEIEYGVSGQKAKKTAKLLKKRKQEGEFALGGGA